MFGLGILIPNIVLLETVTPTQAGVTITPAYIVESPTILNPLSVALVASITTALPSMPLASMTQAPLQLRLIDLFRDTSEKNFLNIFYNFDLKENSVLKNYKVDKLEIKNIKFESDIAKTGILVELAGKKDGKNVLALRADLSLIHI